MLAILLLGLAHIVYMRATFDDAFITYRYAENLAHGHGLVYNAGERLEGYSNFLWTMLMSLVIALGGSPEAWGPRLSAAIAMATLALVMWAAHRRGMNAPLTGVLLAASTCWATWATGGLETALFTGLVTLGGIALMTPVERRGTGNRRALVVSGLSFGLACLTRPDGPLVAGCAGLAVLVLAARGWLTRRHALLWLGLLALLVLPYEIWRMSYYGRLLPNSFAVKSPGLEGLVPGAGYLMGAVRNLHLYLLALPIVLALTLRASVRGLRPRDLAIVAAIVGPYTLFIATTGGDFMPVFRYIAPLVPLMTLVSASALQGVSDRLRVRGAATAGALLIALVVLAYAGLNLRYSWREQHPWVEREVDSVGLAREQVADWLRIGDMLRRVTLPTDTLATTAAGAVPYRSRLYTIDMLGINAPDLSHFHRRDTHRPGHMLMLGERYLDERPPQILLGQPLVQLTPEHIAFGLDLRSGWRDRVLSHFDFMCLALPGEPVRYVGCGLRLDVTQRVIREGSRAQEEGRD